MSDHYEYDDYADEGRFGKGFSIAIIVLILAALFFFLPRCSNQGTTITPSDNSELDHKSSEDQRGNAVMVDDPNQESSDVKIAPMTESSEEKTIAATRTDAELATIVHATLVTGNLNRLQQLLGMEVMSDDVKEKMQLLQKNGRLSPADVKGVKNIGELELNRHRRWAVPLRPVLDRATSPLLLDIKRNVEGRWNVTKLSPPLANGGADFAVADSLAVSSSFLSAVENQDLAAARSYADVENISDVKIAALCILFEEGQYRFREKNPLSAMIRKENRAAYIANVEGMNGGKSAKFGLNLERSDGDAWRIDEINLDSLLSDYTRKMGGQDVQFAPLVKNPEGGDTLVIYFDFDSAELTQRLQRQLDIVSFLLKGDARKKIQISGHADALGSDGYNNDLSATRARAVTGYLAEKGVDPAQIVTLAEGEHRPLRPNTTVEGEDDPMGRRANRRTEIYLDF